MTNKELLNYFQEACSENEGDRMDVSSGMRYTENQIYGVVAGFVERILAHILYDGLFEYHNYKGEDALEELAKDLSSPLYKYGVKNYDRYFFCSSIINGYIRTADAKTLTKLEAIIVHHRKHVYGTSEDRVWYDKYLEIDRELRRR